MALGGVRLVGLHRWPPLLLLYCAICPPAAVLIDLAFWPMWRERPLLALGNVVLSMALLCAGILLLDEPAQGRSAGMLLGSSVLSTIGWLNTWKVGPLPLLSVPASPAAMILAAWATFCYPNSPHGRRAGNRFFIGLLTYFLAGVIICIVVSRPQWDGFPASAWWPALFPDRSLSTAVSEAIDLSGIGFAVAYMLLWAARWRRSHGITRTLTLPVAIAASIICAITLVELVANFPPASDHVRTAIYTIEAYVQISLPAAFVVSVLRRRFARTRIADLLLRLRGPERTSGITDALRTVLEDPALEVVDRAPEMKPDARRLCLPVISSSGEQLAVILADSSLSMNGDLVAAAVAASSFALENARLEAALADQLREVHDSRLRIIQAGIAERRRLEQDLHDGTQQRLLALKIMLAAAESDTADQETRVTMRRVRSEMALVIDELRDVAHGVHPAVLSQVGLDQAIKSMADRYTIPIDVDLPSGQFGETAELTAYYVIAESVTNAIKHARACRISVRGSTSGGTLRITVADDGQGGASAAAGSGIRGLIDRVRAIGGDVELDSPPGHGTTMRAVIPCG